MDYFNHDEAAQLIKAAIEANSLHMTGNYAQQGHEAVRAKSDALYLLTLLTELQAPKS